MSVILLLDPNDYYSQRNNSIDPMVACMPTARVMFYKANNIEYNNPTKMVDDDYFMYSLNTKEAKDFCYNKYPWAYNKENPEKSIPPNQVHGMYNSYLDPLVCGKRVSDFSESLSFENYVDRVVNKKQAIMTSGEFAYLKGHAVIFMGYDTKSKELIIADPYGDFHSNYVRTRGYGVRINRKEFGSIIKPTGLVNKKWGSVLI